MSPLYQDNAAQMNVLTIQHSAVDIWCGSTSCSFTRPYYWPDRKLQNGLVWEMVPKHQHL